MLIAIILGIIFKGMVTVQAPLWGPDDIRPFRQRARAANIQLSNS